MISQKEEMRTGTESSGVVLHDMIERIYFYFIIFSQKKNGKRETHGRRGSSCCLSLSADLLCFFLWRENTKKYVGYITLYAGGYPKFWVKMASGELSNFDAF